MRHAGIVTKRSRDLGESSMSVMNSSGDVSMPVKMCRSTQRSEICEGLSPDTETLTAPCCPQTSELRLAVNRDRPTAQSSPVTNGISSLPNGVRSLVGSRGSISVEILQVTCTPAIEQYLQGINQNMRRFIRDLPGAQGHNNSSGKDSWQDAGKITLRVRFELTRCDAPLVFMS